MTRDGSRSQFNSSNYMPLKFGLRSGCMVCAFWKPRRVALAGFRGQRECRERRPVSGSEWGAAVLYLYLPSCRALSLSASLCCFLQGIWRSLTLPSKSIVLAICSPPILLYLLSSSPSPHFFPHVSSPPRISSLLIFLPSNPVCTILPLSLHCSSLTWSHLPELLCRLFFFFFCHFAISLSLFFPATLFPPIFSQFSSPLPRHLPWYSPFSSLALSVFPTLQSPSLFQPLLSSHLSPSTLSPPSASFLSPPLLPSHPTPLLVSQPIPLIVSSRIRLSRSLRLPNTSPPIPASHFFTFHCRLI